MTRRPSLCALALAALCLPALARAYELKRDPAGAPVRFAQKEVVFRLPAKLPPGVDAAEVREAVERALTAWAQVSGLRLRAEPGSPDAKRGYDPAGDNRNDILFSDADWAWDERAVAVTLLTVDATAHTILDVDIVLNARQHRFKRLAADGAAALFDDLENVMTHELGHAVGLGHSPRRDATMYFETDRGEVSKRALSADDAEGVRALYPAAQSALQSPALAESGESDGAVGCGTTGGAPALAAALVAIPAAARRRRS